MKPSILTPDLDEKQIFNSNFLGYFQFFILSNHLHFFAIKPEPLGISTICFYYYTSLYLIMIIR